MELFHNSLLFFPASKQMTPASLISSPLGIKNTIIDVRYRKERVVRSKLTLWIDCEGRSLYIVTGPHWQHSPNLPTSLMHSRIWEACDGEP